MCFIGLWMDRCKIKDDNTESCCFVESRLETAEGQDFLSGLPQNRL